jgi:hypothetical protein
MKGCPLQGVSFGDEEMTRTPVHRGSGARFD